MKQVKLDLTDPKVREAEAMRRVMLVRSELQQNRVFYGVLVGNTKPVITRRVPRAATNGKQHLWNPEYVLSLPPNLRKLLGVQVHESEHDARHHSTRRGGRDPVRFNKACDYAINGDIIKQGFELPEDVLFREDLAGKSAEEIYRILLAEELAEQQKQQQAQPQPEADSDPGQGEKPEGKDESNGDEGEEPEDGDEESEQEGEGEDGDDWDTDDEGIGPEEEKELFGDEDGEPEEGQGEAEGEEEGEGEGEGQESAPGDAEGDQEGDGEASISCGDGGMGEVLDAPGDEGEVADQDTKWEVIVKQAAAMAKKAGDLPGHWTVELEKRKTPTEDWRSVLREYIDAGATTTQTFNRPNKRFLWSGTVLPGNQRDGVNKVGFILDTSASMSAYQRNSLVANEVQAAMDAGLISEAIAIQCDTVIQDVERFGDGDTVDLTPKGFGSTNMRPGFKWFEENEPDCSLIVCLTDLEIPDPGQEPDCPVLWASYGPPSLYKFKPTWGKVIDVGCDVT